MTHHQAAIYKTYVTQSNAPACASRRRESVRSEALSLKQLCRNCFDPGPGAFFPTPHAMATIRGFETRQKTLLQLTTVFLQQILISQSQTNPSLACRVGGENQKVKPKPTGRPSRGAGRDKYYYLVTLFDEERARTKISHYDSAVRCTTCAYTR